MILVVDPHSGVPVYRQLVEQIRFFVASGVLKPGEEIESTRTLSTNLGINPMTISKAFGILEKEKVLERRPGRPHIVSQLQSQIILSTKLEQLRKALRPVATKTRQLQLDTDAAVELFRALLDGKER